jgi:hypothetical protein
MSIVDETEAGAFPPNFHHVLALAVGENELAEFANSAG